MILLFSLSGDLKKKWSINGLSPFYRLGELREVERNHKLELDRGRCELRQLVEDSEKVRNSTPGLEDKFRFYQELRGYVTDLVECLDEKVGLNTLQLSSLPPPCEEKLYYCVSRTFIDINFNNKLF